MKHTIFNMVFWSSYPFYNIFCSKFSNNVFLPLLFDKPPLESPTGSKALFLTKHLSPKHIQKFLSQIRIFLQRYFGNPPSTPTLDIPEAELLGERDHIIFVLDVDRNIVGCARYHYLGFFITHEGEPMYCVDCFCIHPNWRKKGVGDYLLTTLHNYVNQKQIPYSLFLKEGSRLNILYSALYSGMYVYRKINAPRDFNSSYIKNLTTYQAYRLMDIFREVVPNIFIIRNIHARNQIWKLYKNGSYKILACFQDTFQRFEEDEQTQRIGWITAWIESPTISDNIREHASILLADSMSADFDYIWANSTWVGNSSNWKIDGPFHWYVHQWATAISVKKSYCILN